MHLVEHIQGGISAAEIVHLNHKSAVPQFVHHCNDLIGIFGVGALGQLQVQLTGLNAILGNQAAYGRR